MHVPLYFFATSDLLYVWDKATPEGKAIIFTLAVFSIFAWSVMASKAMQRRRASSAKASCFHQRNGACKAHFGTGGSAAIAAAGVGADFAGDRGQRSAV